jgi:hypothetical protein
VHFSTIGNQEGSASEIRSTPVMIFAGALRKRGKRSPLFEIARVFVSFDHVAGIIVNANHNIT